MTQTGLGTTFTSPPLERPAHAPLAGVCLALARTTGTDVVLWRVLFVVTTLFGGLGLAAYLVGYVAIPKEGAGPSLAVRLVRGPDRRVSTRQLLLLALVVVVVAGALHDNGGAVVVVALLAGYLLWRRRHPADGAVESAAVPPEAVPAAGTVPVEADPWGLAGGAAPAWQPPPARQRSVVAPLTLSVAALVVGALLLLAAAGSASVPTEVVLAAALGVVGLGLVASAFFGRARGLIPVALLLALALGGTLAARPAIDHGIGERQWSATTTGSYRLGIGHGTVALPADAPDGGHVAARVSLGQLTVVVPEGLHVIVNAEVVNGAIQGFDVDENGRQVSHTFELGPSGTPALVVDAHVGAGQVEVRRG